MSLKNENNSMDIATMALVLYFVPDPMLGMAEMKRVVKPGGIIAAYVWDVFGGGMPFAPLHRELHKRKNEYQLPPKAEVSKLDKLKRLWIRADLKSTECKQIRVS
jgi:ubiquinone/menaquinone biosynthesis C-methylase UbiE